MADETYGFADDKPDTSTQEGRALTVAIQALTQAIAPMPQAIIENTKAYAVLNDDDGGPTAEPPSKPGKPKDGAPEPAEAEGRPTRKSTARSGSVDAVRSILAADRQEKAATDPDKKKGSPKPKDDGLGKLAAGAESVAGSFLKILGPAAVLAQLMGSSAGGMQTLAKATQLLTMVFAPILLPVVMLLAVAFVGLAELLFTTGLPVMKLWFSLMGYGVQFLQAWINKIAVMIILFQKLADWVSRIIGGKKEATPEPEGPLAPGTRSDVLQRAGREDTPDKIREKAQRNWEARREANKELNEGKINQERFDQIKRMEESFYDDFAGDRDTNRHMLVNPDAPGVGRRVPEMKPTAPEKGEFMVRPEARVLGPDGQPIPGQPGAPGAAGGVPGLPNMKGILEEVIKSFKDSVGPKATMSGLANVANEKAMQALNVDPLEARMERMMQKIVELLGEVAGGVKPQPQGQFAAPGVR